MVKKPSGNILFSTLRKVGRILTPQEKKRSIVLMAIALLGSVMDVARLILLVPILVVAMKPEVIHSSALLSWMFNSMGFEDTNSFTLFLVLAVLGVFIITTAITLWMNYAQTSFAFDVATDISRRQHIKYMNKNLQYFKDISSGEIINNIRNIPSFFATGILLRYISLFSEVTIASFVIIGLGIYDIWLLLAVLAFLLPAAALMYYTTKNRLLKLGEMTVGYAARSLSIVNESVRGYVDLKIYNREEYFRNEMVKNHEKSFSIQKTVTIIQLLPAKSIELFAVAGVVVIFLYSYIWSSDRQRLVEFLIAFSAAAFRVLPSLNRLLQSMMSIKNHIYTLDILLEDELPKEEGDTSYEKVTFEDSIELKNMGYKFHDGNQFAIQNFSLKIKKGEKIGIVGSSGSGKTTLMNILLRFYMESEGDIEVDGKKLTPDQTRGWRDLLGYVQQDVFLLDGTLKENIVFGENPSVIDEARLKEVLERASLKEFVDQLPKGLDTPAGEMGGKISGGQRQRIGIARALYRNSQIILFDEATSALDSETEKEITDAIQHSVLADTTVIIIAHRLTTLRICDRIVEMANGEITGIYDYKTLLKDKLV